MRCITLATFTISGMRLLETDLHAVFLVSVYRFYNNVVVIPATVHESLRKYVRLWFGRSALTWMFPGVTSTEYRCN